MGAYTRIVSVAMNSTQLCLGADILSLEEDISPMSGCINADYTTGGLTPTITLAMYSACACVSVITMGKSHSTANCWLCQSITLQKKQSNGQERQCKV